MQQLRVEFTSKTPLWTGDKNKNGNHLRATGLLGSLRFWYWVMKRLDHPEDPDAAVTLRDFMFGTTSWERPYNFRLGACQATTSAGPFRFKFGAAFRWTGSFSIVVNRRISNPIETFERSSEKQLQHSLPELVDFESHIIQEWKKLAKFVETYGFWGIGGQNGLGLVEFNFEGNDEVLLPELSSLICSSRQLEVPDAFTNQTPQSLISLDGLRGYFQEKIRRRTGQVVRRNEDPERDFKIKNYRHNLSVLGSVNTGLSFLPIAFEIRDWIRHHNGFRTDADRVFGISSRELTDAGVVFFSHPYKKTNQDFTVRITVANRPDRDSRNVDCDEVIDRIQRCLGWETSQGENQ